MATLVGSGQAGFLIDGPALTATLIAPFHIAQEPNGDLVWTEPSSMSRVRRYSLATGNVSTVIGYIGVTGYTNGLTTKALINNPRGITVSPDGTIYITEGSSNSFVQGVRVITCASALPSASPSPGSAASASATVSPAATPTPSPTASVATCCCTVTTLAGVPTVFGTMDGVGSGASFNQPTGILVDRAGNVVTADRQNFRLRAIDPLSGTTTTVSGGAGSGLTIDGLAGAQAGFNQPFAMDMDATGGVIFVAEVGSHRIRRVTYPGGVATTYAGSNQGYSDSIWFAAQFNTPSAVAVGPTGAV